MAKTKRECPALGETISSARCGEERGVIISCPPNCAYNPFAPVNYEHLPDLERRLFEKTLHRFEETFGDRAATSFQDDMGRTMSHPLVQFGVIQRRFYHDPDPTGQSLAKRWAQDRWTGLNQDERRLFQCQVGTRLALLEAHRQIDDQSVEAVDLLDPERKRLVLVDRRFPDVWVRFGTYLTWVYDAPHFCRLCGLLLELPHMGTREPDEWFPIILSFLGGPAEIHLARDWLTDNLEQFLKCQRASATAMNAAMLDRLEGRFGRARYRWRHPGSPAKMRSRLAAAPDLNEGEVSRNDLDDGWVTSWNVVDRAATAATKTTVPLLGWILAGPDGVLLKAPSDAQFAKLKHRFEELAGDDVAFEAERVDDLPAQLRAQGKFDYDASLVPPQLLEDLGKLTVATSLVSADSPDTTEKATQDYFRQLYHDFADQPVPALQNRTPRQAATDPALRPALVRLLKGHVRSLDREALRRGTVQDINWLIRDLGLNEIELPPPPLRTPPDNEWDEDDFEDDDAEDEDTDDNEDLFSAFDSLDDLIEDHRPGTETPPPSRILSEKEVYTRLNELVRTPEKEVAFTMDDTFEEWEGLKPVLDLTDIYFNEEESVLLAIHLWQMIKLLHPVTPPSARLNPKRWKRYYEKESNHIIKLTAISPDDLADDAFSRDIPQPAVASWLAYAIFDRIDADKGRLKSRRSRQPTFRPSAGIMALCLLRALLRELCHWPIK